LKKRFAKIFLKSYQKFNADELQYHCEILDSDLEDEDDEEGEDGPFKDEIGSMQEGLFGDVETCESNSRG